MSWQKDLARLGAKYEKRAHDMFVKTVETCYESIVEGSPVTGAPGQPVDTGALRASWQTIYESRTRAKIVTMQIYAPAIEDAVGPHGPLTLRSEVGGFHSVKLTIAGYPLVVRHAASQVP